MKPLERRVCAVVAVLLLLIAPHPLGAAATVLLGSGPGVHAVEGEDRSGHTGGLPPAEADTLSLAEAVRTALDRNPHLAAGRADVSAEATARWADWGSLLPDVRGAAHFARVDGTRFTFQGEEGVSRRAGEPIDFVRKGVEQSFEVDWQLLDGGRRWFDIKRGAARKKAASFRLEARKRGTVARVKRVYFEALEEQQLADAAERQLKARRRELEMTRHRRDLGSATRADLLGARLEVGKAEVRRNDAERRSARDRQRLREVMGVRAEEPPAVERVATVGVPELDSLDETKLVERAVSTDPEARAFGADREAASAASSESWTRYAPDVWLNYTGWRSEIGGADADFFTLDPSDSFGQLTFSVTWDLFDGFERREATARAKAEAQRAQARRRDRVLELETGVVNGIEEIRSRYERLQVLERNRGLARERLELARMRYEEGQLDFDELQPFIDDVIEAEKAVVSERAEYLTAWAHLERLVGDLPAAPGPDGR